MPSSKYMSFTWWNFTLLRWKTHDEVRTLLHLILRSEIEEFGCWFLTFKSILQIKFSNRGKYRSNFRMSWMNRAYFVKKLSTIYKILVSLILAQKWGVVLLTCSQCDVEPPDISLAMASVRWLLSLMESSTAFRATLTSFSPSNVAGSLAKNTFWYRI